ncbi:MAG: hypothetical protein M0R80_07065 [Proteobacteria bacterium]|nr:hypothetical protein [Pseudomonadota bacterium]
MRASAPFCGSVCLCQFRVVSKLRRSAGDKLLSAMLTSRVSEIEGVDDPKRPIDEVEDDLGFVA